MSSLDITKEKAAHTFQIKDVGKHTEEEIHHRGQAAGLQH